MKDHRGVVVLVGSGEERYRGYLVASAARTHPLWLLDVQEPTWQRAYVKDSQVVDIYNPDALVAAIRQLARYRPVLGVLCYHEGAVLAAAHASAALGLPGAGPGAVANCRDKGATRRLLAAASVPQPAFALVSTPDEAARAARSIGFPLVLKPRGLGASQGVIKVASVAELSAAFQISRSASQPGMPAFPDLLLEEFIDGPEISVDGALFDGVYRPLFIAHKRVGAAPYFEETGHVVVAADPLLADRAVLGTLTGAHAALGVKHGITHTELKPTSRGAVLIEVNARLGGDLIPYLGWLATGIDPAGVALALATGRPARAVATHQGCAGIRFLYPPRDAVLRSATLPQAHPGRGLLEVGLLAQIGDTVRLPPGDYAARYGYLIATGKDASSCTASLDEAEAQVRAEWDDLPSRLPEAS